MDTIHYVGMKEKVMLTDIHWTGQIYIKMSTYEQLMCSLMFDFTTRRKKEKRKLNEREREIGEKKGRASEI